MAKFTRVNRLVATGAEAMFNIKETLKDAGWTVKSSSDGTTYNATGDQITTGSSGAGGMANNSAWYRIQDPGTRREYVIQRGTTNLVWRIKYSPLAQFTGGVPGTTRVPSATDEAVLLGAGTDASPTFTSYFTTDGTYYWHVIAQSTPIGGVYGFWAFGTNIATGITRSAFMCEPLLSGSYSSGDQDPVIMMVVPNALTLTLTNLSSSATSSNQMKGYFKFNLSGATFVNFAGGIFSNGTAGNSLFPGNMGTNPYDRNDNGVPIFFYRAASFTTQIGPKGYANYIRWKAINKSYPAVYNLTSDSMVYVDDILVPWEDNTMPAV